MTRKILWVVSMALLLACAALSAETVTLPAAASIVGGAPFFSDVRAFNTSYTDSLEVDGHVPMLHRKPVPGNRTADDLHSRTAGVAGLRRHRRVGLQRAEHSRRRRIRPLGLGRPARRHQPPFLDRAPGDGRHVHSGPGQLGGPHDHGPDLDPQSRARRRLPDERRRVQSRGFGGHRHVLDLRCQRSGRWGASGAPGRRALGAPGLQDLRRRLGAGFRDRQRGHRRFGDGSSLFLRRGHRQRDDRPHLRGRRRGPAAAAHHPGRVGDSDQHTAGPHGDAARRRSPRRHPRRRPAGAAPSTPEGALAA